MTHIQNISPETLKNWIDNNDVVLIDVRELDEFNAGHIKQAIHLPLSRFDPADVPHNQKEVVVFQCHLGRRSERACSFFLKDYPDVKAYNLEGGIAAWTEAGLPVIYTHHD